MNQNFSYYMPTKIVFGNSELNNIDKYINGRKTILITSNGFIKRGLVNKIKSLTNNIVEVISEVKSHPELKRIPVVVLTTSEAETDIVKSYELHANCYITKPVDINEFIEVIKSIENFWFNIVKLPIH